jgi:hypothetical protein
METVSLQMTIPDYNTPKNKIPDDNTPDDIWYCHLGVVIWTWVLSPEVLSSGVLSSVALLSGVVAAVRVLLAEADRRREIVQSF